MYIMNFNYFANGDYEIKNDDLFENFKSITENFSDETEETSKDPYIETNVPCLEGIKEIIQNCTNEKLTMPKSSYENLVKLEKKINSGKDKFQGKQESKFKDSELDKFRNYIEDVDRFNSEIEIITDWNNNLKKNNSQTESSETSDSSETVESSNENGINDIVDKIKKVEDDLYEEEVRLTKLKKELREEENKENLKIVEETLKEEFSIIDTIKSKYNESDVTKILKDGIKKSEDNINFLIEQSKLLNEQIVKSAKHNNKQNEEDDQLNDKMNEERRKMDDERKKMDDEKNDIEDEESDILDNHLIASVIIGMIVIILIILYYTLR
jgi:hypothetical protein